MSRNALNGRRWPRSTAVYRPTAILSPDHPVAVLTTGAVATLPPTTRNALPATLTTAATAPLVGVSHNVSLAAVTPVGVAVLPGSGKDVSRGVLVTVAVLAHFTGLATHAVNVLTTMAADTYPGFGTTQLLDQNGNPILDQNGNPILVAGQVGYVKSTPIVVAPSVAVGVYASTQHDLPVTGLVPVGVVIMTATTKGVVASVLTTGTANADGVTQHSEPLFINIPVGVATQAESSRSASIAALVTGAGSPVADVSHEVSVAALVTAAVHQASDSLHAADIQTVSDALVGAFVSVATARDALIEANVTAGALVSTVVEHLASIGVLTTGAPDANVSTAHEFETFSSITFGAAHTTTAAIREAIIEVLTTAGADTHLSLTDLTRICLELFWAFDTVTVEMEECD